MDFLQLLLRERHKLRLLPVQLVKLLSVNREGQTYIMMETRHGLAHIETVKEGCCCGYCDLTKPQLMTDCFNELATFAAV